MSNEQAVPPEAHWRAALEDGRVLLQRDPASGQMFFPPRLAGPAGQDLEWVEASRLGSVYAVTVVYPRPPKEPYNVALVDLAEGPRMMSRIEGIAPEDVAVGMPVSMAIASEQEGATIVFHPA